MAPAVLAAGVQAGGNLLSQGLNAFTTMATNRASRKWSEQMYGRQRADALADWAMQNEYNSPKAQMERFKAAGLNPNLIYGQGSEGNAQQVRQSSVEGWNPEAPKFDFGGTANAIAAYYDIKMKEQTIDNLTTQNTVMTNDALLKMAQTLSTLQGTEASKFDLSLKQDLRATTLEAAKASLNKTMAETKSTIDENERRAAMQAPNFQAAVENVLNLRASRAKTKAEEAHIRQQIENLKKDGKLKEMDIQLRQLGIMPSDPMYMRVLGRVLNSESEFAPGGTYFPGKKFEGNNAGKAFRKK